MKHEQKCIHNIHNAAKLPALLLELWNFAIIFPISLLPSPLLLYLHLTQQPATVLATKSQLTTTTANRQTIFPNGSALRPALPMRNVSR